MNISTVWSWPSIILLFFHNLSFLKFFQDVEKDLVMVRLTETDLRRRLTFTKDNKCKMFLFYVFIIYIVILIAINREFFFTSIIFLCTLFRQYMSFWFTNFFFKIILVNILNIIMNKYFMFIYEMSKRLWRINSADISVKLMYQYISVIC